MEADNTFGPHSSSSSMSDSVAVARAIQNARIVSYFNVASIVLLVYDFFLTIILEINTVWKSKWSVSKILYLVTRYTAFLEAIVILYQQAIPGRLFNACLITFKINAWLLVFGLGAGEILLSIRTWAVWRSSRKLGIALIIIWSVVWILGFAVVGIFLETLRFEPNSLTPFLGCYVTNANPILFLCWVVLLFYDTLMLVLMAIPAYKAFRRGGSPGMLKMVYRDGVIFYSYLFILSLINIVVILKMPFDLVTLLSMMERVLHSVFTCRVILHLQAQKLQDPTLDNVPGVPIEFKNMAQSRSTEQTTLDIP